MRPKQTVYVIAILAVVSYILVVLRIGTSNIQLISMPTILLIGMTQIARTKYVTVSLTNFGRNSFKLSSSFMLQILSEFECEADLR